MHVSANKLTVIDNPPVTVSGQIPTASGKGRPAGAHWQPEAPVDRPDQRQLRMFAARLVMDFDETCLRPE